MWLYIWNSRNTKTWNVDVWIKFSKNWVQHGTGPSNYRRMKIEISTATYRIHWKRPLRNHKHKLCNTLYLLWLFLHNIIYATFRFIFQRIKTGHLKKGIEGLGLFFNCFLSVCWGFFCCCCPWFGFCVCVCFLSAFSINIKET